MIKLLAKMGRFQSVIITTIIAAAAAVLVTAAAVVCLNLFDYSIRLNLAVIFAAGVALVVTPPISWVLVDMTLRIYKIEKEMRDLASYDSLTGLLSRHAFFESAGSYVSLANRHRNMFTVMIIDLDHFKSINDQFGHPAGDAVLKLFADVVNSMARRSDITGRLGGEEFALILPSTNTVEALEFSDRLHKAIKQAVLKYKNSLIPYTVSIGLVSSNPEKSVSIDRLLAQADLALYQAKRDGRNKTSVFKNEIDRVAVG